MRVQSGMLFGDGLTMLVHSHLVHDDLELAHPVHIVTGEAVALEFARKDVTELVRRVNDCAQ